jgi:ribosome biogenesis SPOUT family RNA methylase Rps3
MSVLDLMKNRAISLHRVCLLDPKSSQELTPEDGDGAFDWFLFGVRPCCFGFCIA